MKTPTINFPLILKLIRAHLNESQSQFAKRFSVTNRTVGRWENNDNPMPYAVISFVILSWPKLKEAMRPITDFAEWQEPVRRRRITAGRGKEE